MPPPAYEYFPVINSTAADIATWVSQGWQVHDYRTVTPASTACNNAEDDVLTWSKSSSWLQPRLVLLPKCEFEWDYKEGNAPFQLRNDLAIWTYGSFDSQNANSIEGRTTSGGALPACASGQNTTAAGGTCERELYLVVPNDTPGKCNNNDIEIHTQFDTKSVNTLFYTPCDIQVDNNLGLEQGNVVQPFKGQLYAGGFVSTGSQTHILMGNLGVPNLAAGGGAPPPPVTSASATVEARYDLAGS